MTASDGPDDQGPWIEQRYHALPGFEGNHPLLGSWVVADRACGLGVREDDSLITQDTSRFVPHVIVADDSVRASLEAFSRDGGSLRA